MDLKRLRLENGRKVIKRFGGVAQVARKMGYKNASYLVQIFGPNPTRPPSEKTCRALEEAMGLIACELDRDAEEPAVVLSDSVAQTKLIGAISLVNRVADSEGVTLSAEKLAVLVGLVYEEAHLSPNRWLHQVIQMIK